MKKMLWIFLALSLFLFTCNSSTEPEEEDLTAPEIPVGLTVDQVSSLEDSCKLTWAANTETDLSGYNIYKAVENVSGAFNKVGNASMNEESFTCSGLDYDTTYYFKISAFDKNGNESDLSAAVSHKPINVNAPEEPSNIKVYGYNDDPEAYPYINIRWDANRENDFDHYDIYKHTLAAYSIDDSTYFLAGVTATSYIDTAIEVGVTYYYRVVAVDKGGKSSNSTVPGYDQALPSPGLFAPADGATTSDRTPDFVWERVEGATKYEIIVSTSKYSGEYWIGEFDQPASGFEVEGTYSGSALTTGTRYYWKVAAYSSDNTAVNAYSEIFSFWTPSK